MKRRRKDQKNKNLFGKMQKRLANLKSYLYTIIKLKLKTCDEEKSSFVFGGKESGAGAKADAFDAVVRAPASGQSE